MLLTYKNLLMELNIEEVVADLQEAVADTDDTLTKNSKKRRPIVWISHTSDNGHP